MRLRTVAVCALLAGLGSSALAPAAQGAPVSAAGSDRAFGASAAVSPAEKDKPYAFMTGKGKKSKARWYPCKPVTWAVIQKGMLPVELPRVTAAFAAIASATGLKFKYKGVSKKHGKSPRFHSPTIPGADIAIVFEDFSKTFPKHAAKSGYAGAQYPSYTSRIGRYEYGYMRVDTPDLPGIPEPMRQVLYMHELGHVIGLDHAPGPNVMNPTLSPDVMQFSPGDLAGLRLLGRQKGDCGSRSPFRSR